MKILFDITNIDNSKNEGIENIFKRKKIKQSEWVTSGHRGGYFICK